MKKPPGFPSGFLISFSVMPAQAGIQSIRHQPALPLDSRLFNSAMAGRGNDGSC
jgi:hypothetical protein